MLLDVAGCGAARPAVTATASGQATAVRQDPSREANDCVSGPTSPRAAPSPGGTSAPPPPGPVSPNASRVVADVLTRSVWAPGTLPVPPLPSNPERVVFSIRLTVVSSTAEAPEYDNKAFPGSTIEAFSCDAIPAELVGTRIEAVLMLTGDTRATRWWISRIHPLP
jgi:hypothetical protein